MSHSRRNFFTRFGYWTLDTYQRALSGRNALSRVRPFFSPDELDAMRAAYNEAWFQFIAGVAILPHQCVDMKE